MAGPARHVLLAVEPGLLQGALASLLSAAGRYQVVQLGRGQLEGLCSDFDAAVVSDELPHGTRADVVITLPDTRGSSGTGTVRSGGVVKEVRISGADQVFELLEQHLPRAV